MQRTLVRSSPARDESFKENNTKLVITDSHPARASQLCSQTNERAKKRFPRFERFERWRIRKYAMKLKLLQQLPKHECGDPERFVSTPNCLRRRYAVEVEHVDLWRMIYAVREPISTHRFSRRAYKCLASAFVRVLRTYRQDERHRRGWKAAILHRNLLGVHCLKIEDLPW